ncbi:glutamate synthase-related protein, partial [Streptomyces sp. NPDC006265]|uniref:glutamate synthase-related protein n=1 Tax=Streptomyces sp. NPDC006265 TaxID=3156740 RepID=UPI0033AFB16E
VGVGTVAAGVSKAHADVVLISGHDGGTGASPPEGRSHGLDGHRRPGCAQTRRQQGGSGGNRQDEQGGPGRRPVRGGTGRRGQRGGVHESGRSREEGDTRPPRGRREQHRQRGQHDEGCGLGREADQGQAGGRDQSQDEGRDPRGRRAPAHVQRRRCHDAQDQQSGGVRDLKDRRKDQRRGPEQAESTEPGPRTPRLRTDRQGEHSRHDQQHDRSRDRVGRPGGIDDDRRTGIRRRSAPHPAQPSGRAQKHHGDDGQRPQHRQCLYGTGGPGEARPYRVRQPSGPHDRQQGDTEGQMSRDHPLRRQPGTRHPTERTHDEQPGRDRQTEGVPDARPAKGRAQRDRRREQEQRPGARGVTRTAGRQGQPAGTQNTPAAHAVGADDGGDPHRPGRQPRHRHRVEPGRHQQCGRDHVRTRIGGQGPQQQRELGRGQGGRQGQAQRG